MSRLSRIEVYRDHEAGTPGVMRCDCGKALEIHDHHDVRCQCGRNYNSAGQLLAHRSQWGEETGETAADYDAGVAEAESESWAETVSQWREDESLEAQVGDDDED